MASGKSDFLEARILNHFLGAVADTATATTFIALSTAAYSDSATGTSMSEVSSSGTAYARVSKTNNTTNWPTATGTSPTTKSNGTAITFVTATASWGTVLSFYICDAVTGGNIYYGGDLTSSQVVNTGDTPSFAVGALTVTED